MARLGTSFDACRLTSSALSPDIARRCHDVPSTSSLPQFLMMAYPGTQLIPAFRKALKIFIIELIIFRQLDKNVLF